MSTKSDTKSGAAGREIVATRIFDAPRELVWEAWTDPDKITRWWGPNGFTTTTVEIDVRPGGIWKHIMHGPDGTDYPNLTRYVELVKPERIVYINSGGKDDIPHGEFRATITFEDEEGRTRLTVRMEFASVSERDRVAKEYGAVEGLEQHLARLRQFLENNPINSQKG
ncbi:MAG: SRPBCC domain-containing protein [bacterium]|jgi:uncharacterized protein YndB with AHSA1/START domain